MDFRGTPTDSKGTPTTCVVWHLAPCDT